MIEFTKRIDDALDRFCVWLNDFFPGDPPLPLWAPTAAGGGRRGPRPIGGPLSPSALVMKNNAGDRGSAARAGPGTAGPEDKCEFWAYCHMNGQPCVWCSGKNAIQGVSD